MSLEPAALDELQQHAAALRRLARDLVGAGGADDVMQDTALEVMRAPPRRPGPLLAWLRQVVRHVAGKQRRADAVRRRHECAAASERSFELAGAAAADSLRSLTTWLTALPEPYRSTLLARYVQELTPTAIAAASGVPVRTVKIRLQRGLALLRQRGERSGGDWRGAFVLAFGLDGREVAVAATGVAGAVSMGMMTKGGMVAGALALVGIAIWQWPGIRGTATPPTTPVAGALPVAAAIPAGPGREAPDAAVPERTPVAVSAPPRAGADDVVVCVVDAATGQPITAYGLREHMAPQALQLGVKSYPLLHGGEHADGRLVLPSSAFVDRNFVVEDAAGRYLPSRWFDARDAVERDGERRIDVRLPLPVEVRVKVVRERTGEAFVGTRVELLRPWISTSSIRHYTTAAPSDRFRAQANEPALAANAFGGRALLVGDVRTDATGEALLRVPLGESFALRLTSNLHQTRVVESWQAPADARAEVVFALAAGATVRGRITPASALAALRVQLAEFVVAQQPEAAQLFATGVRLEHAETREARPAGRLGWEPVVLFDDGTFEVGGLAPGTWRLFFRYALILEPRGLRAHFPQQFEFELPKLVALTDGEVRIVDIDAREWVPGTLRAQLPRDHRMAPEGSLVLRQIASNGAPMDRHGQAGAAATPGAVVEMPLPPARYLATWHRPSPTTTPPALPAGVAPFVLGEIEIRPGAVTAVDLALDADTVAIRVWEADGTTPARGMLRLQRAGWYAGIEIDANGTATFDAMPRSGEVRATFHRWNAEHPNGPFADAIDLGTLRPDGNPIELRLPAR